MESSLKWQTINTFKMDGYEYGDENMTTFIFELQKYI